MKSDPVIVTRKVEALIPYARNSRTHSDAQVAQIAASVREFGWTNPILIDGENGIIAGHGRVLAARKLGMDDVPCIELAGLTEAQRRAYIIADNKLALNAGWDDELLAIEFAELADAGFDTLLTGFTQDEIDALTPEQIPEGLTDEDAVPEVQPDPISKLGDVWVLGKHRLMCGDSTSIDAIERLMDAAKADMVFTDPPYGMSYGGGRAQGNHSLNKRGG
jgi:ParB-like chromosome segregation protein Spo0J